MDEKITTLPRSENQNVSGKKDSSSPSERLLTAMELSERLKISRSMVYKLVKNGQLECIRLGRLVRFSPDCCQRLLEDQTDSRR